MNPFSLCVCSVNAELLGGCVCVCGSPRLSSIEAAPEVNSVIKVPSGGSGNCTYLNNINCLLTVLLMRNGGLWQCVLHLKKSIK